MNIKLIVVYYVENIEEAKVVLGRLGLIFFRKNNDRNRRHIECLTKIYTNV